MRLKKVLPHILIKKVTEYNLLKHTNTDLWPSDKPRLIVRETRGQPEARPTNRNISTQHLVTLLGTTCCVRLTTLLRRGQILQAAFVAAA